MELKEFDSVWDAIEDTPEAAELMKLRSGMMMQITQYIQANKLTQAEAAKRFGVTQPRISDLMRGKINLFGLDTLVQMAIRAGLKVEFKLAA